MSLNAYAGLMHDDLLDETPDVKEAVKRLPPPVYDARQFRLFRAVELSARHDYLPKEEWTKFEEDVRYLQPYLEEVQREREEREKWEDSH